MSAASRFDTTSDTIRENRASISARLAKDPGFREAMETDAEKQRDVVSRWLACPHTFSGTRKWTGANRTRTATKAAGTKARRVITSPSAISPAIEESTTCINAIDGTSISAASEMMQFLENIATVGVARAEAPNLGAVIKTPAGSTTAAYTDFRHEAFVAIFGTNTLRSQIPNFPFVYAYLETPSVKTTKVSAKRAASPRRKILDSETETASACPAILVEDVGEATNPTVATAITSQEIGSERDFAEILIQVAYALKAASEAVSFTHYDLQAGNVVLRPITNTEGEHVRAFLPYDECRTYVSARWIASFIEFGFSHITVANSERRKVPFGFSAKGKAELVELGIFRDRENPMTDVYRLVMTSAAIAIRAKNAPVVAVARTAFRYFNSLETLEDAIEAQSENYFYLPLTAKARLYNFDDFVAFLRREARNEKWVQDVRALTIATPANGTVPKRGVGSGSKFVSVIQKKFGPWREDTAVAREDTPSHFELGASFLAFFDTYGSLTERVETEFAAQVAKSYSTAFIRGFSEGKSAFNTALRDAKATATMCSAKSTDAEREKATDAIGYCLIRLVDLRQAMRFATEVYWEGDTIPPEVRETFSFIDSVIETMSERLARSNAIAPGRPDVVAAVFDRCRGGIDEK